MPRSSSATSTPKPMARETPRRRRRRRRRTRLLLFGGRRRHGNGNRALDTGTGTGGMTPIPGVTRASAASAPTVPPSLRRLVWPYRPAARRTPGFWARTAAPSRTAVVRFSPVIASAKRPGWDPCRRASRPSGPMSFQASKPAPIRWRRPALIPAWKIRHTASARAGSFADRTRRPARAAARRRPGSSTTIRVTAPTNPRDAMGVGVRRRRAAWRDVHVVRRNQPLRALAAGAGRRQPEEPGRPVRRRAWCRRSPARSGKSSTAS